MDQSIQAASLWMSIASVVGFVGAGVGTYYLVRKNAGTCVHTKSAKYSK